VILGTFGASDRFADIPRAPKLSLTSFFVMIYTSSRWLDGRIDTKRLTLPPQPKSNFLYFIFRSSDLYSLSMLRGQIASKYGRNCPQAKKKFLYLLLTIIAFVAILFLAGGDNGSQYGDYELRL
jgi:hypothetical protein